MASQGGVGYDSKGKKLWDKYTPSACLPSQSILRFNSEYNWEVAMEPLHRGIDKANVCGVGPGMLFAHELLKRALSLGVIGLVPCAIGGTYITQWLPGTTYYNQTLKRAFAALKEGVKLRALLYYQGENEAKDGVWCFAVDVPKFFTSIRNEAMSCGSNMSLRFRQDFGTFRRQSGYQRLQQVPTCNRRRRSRLSPTSKGNQRLFKLQYRRMFSGLFIKEVRNLQLQFTLLSMKTVDAIGSKLEDDFHLTTYSISSHSGEKDGRRHS
nr:probable carbohydrate esterase At4g34215 [Ipomoea batatas]